MDTHLLSSKLWPSDSFRLNVRGPDRAADAAGAADQWIWVYSSGGHRL